MDDILAMELPEEEGCSEGAGSLARELAEKKSEIVSCQDPNLDFIGHF